MAEGRFIIEFGKGFDFHGQDVTKAAVKAVREAISQSCLAGLKEVLAIEDLDEGVRIQATVAVSRPEEIAFNEIVNCFPVGKVDVVAVKGGIKVSGLNIPAFGDQDGSIEGALACVEVFV